MEVVLIKRVPKLGHEYDIVNVKPGFARNYLLPNGFAVMATPDKINWATRLKAKVVQKVAEKMENAEQIAAQLKKAVLKFKKKARGEKLYGSIAEKDIVEALKEQHKIEVQKDMVKMDEHIKDLGDHTVTIQLTEEVSAKVKIKIEKEVSKK